MTDDSLKNIYGFMKYLGFIDRIPNIKTVRKNLYQLTAINNICYEILDSSLSNKEKISKLKNIGIFNELQINYIIRNQTKIIKPFRYIIEKRQSNHRKINLQYGGEEQQPTIDGMTLGALSDEQKQKLIENLQKFGINPNLEQPVNSQLIKMPSLFDKITSFDYSKISKRLKSYGLEFSPERLQQMAIRLGIPINQDELIKKIEPYDSIGILQMIENAKYISFAKIQGPPITLKDWIFFPLWSIENLPLAGPVAGIPIDFLSVIIAQLDTFITIWVNTLGNLRDPAVQTAMSFFAAGTAGAGLVAAPAIVPVVNTIFDLLIHTVSHLGTILNMFVHISRKNFGLAYILFCEIVPIFEVFMDTVINYMVIINRFLERTNRVFDSLDVFLDNSAKIIMLLNPAELEKQKQIFIQQMEQQANQRMAGLQQQANQRMAGIQQQVGQQMVGLQQQANQRMAGVQQQANQQMAGVQQQVGQQMVGLQQQVGQQMVGQIPL